MLARIAAWRKSESDLHKLTNGWFGYDFSAIPEEEIVAAFLRDEAYMIRVQSRQDAVNTDGLMEFGYRRDQAVRISTPEMAVIRGETWRLLGIRWEVAFVSHPIYGIVDIPASDLIPASGVDDEFIG
jgi:hypothetical protein